jgi:hypothetical protein
MHDDDTRRILSYCLTVGELIETLSSFEHNMPVVVSMPSRDYWKTELAVPVGTVGETTVEYSDYHQQLKILPETAPTRVVVIG